MREATSDCGTGGLNRKPCTSAIVPRVSMTRICLSVSTPSMSTDMPSLRLIAATLSTSIEARS